MNLAQQAAEWRKILPKAKRDKKGIATHDYTVRVPGHDYTFRPRNGGMEASMCGWGYGLTNGDYLILGHDNGETTRYQIKTVRYFSDPKDMWSAEVVFAPRKQPVGKRRGK